MSLTLLDWRRRVAALYAEIRASSDIGSAHQRWRDERDDLFRHHPDSPLLPESRASFRGLPVAPYDPDQRFQAEVDTDLPPARMEVPTGTDGIVAFDRIGRVHLGERGERGQLDVWWLASYGGGLFIPVKDALAGKATYGGGRYLIDTVKGADLGGDGATLVIDLNFAYNPSCAYDPAWACPLAPPGNVLPGPVMAGELTGHHEVSTIDSTID
ncbi:MAG: uncharacterized protein QOF30_2267 [Acidimicrobiaceae bacterium]|jgi:uncharacterized protein (DUF1684 family)|nr:uncharacterized protein [Acidimicrobiaceae bacterium]